jgi:probable F420-dependent oxidoreductase
MEFGIMLSTFGQHADRENLRRLAQRSEELGLDAVWVGDHITFPEEVPNDYPFLPEGRPPAGFDMYSDAYEAFTLMSHLAGLTDDVQVGVNVAIVPYRHPIILARNAISTHELSDKRLEFGVGIGWMDAEFERLGVPFNERGPRTDEFLDMWEKICEDGAISFDGEFHSFEKTGFFPQPSKGDPPVWVGGHSMPAYRRLAKYGMGWTTVWDRPDALETELEKVHKAWNDENRSGRPEVSVMRCIDVNEDTDRDASRPLIGSADQVISDIEDYEEAGATRITIDFFTKDPEEQLEQLERFGNEVVPSF